MTDMTESGIARDHRRTLTWECRIYFGIIFLICLPWALLSWALGLSMPDSEDTDRGFISRARHQASVITPMIFSA